LNDEQIKSILKEDEGFRLIVYPDTEGVPTVGWGHADKSMKLGASYTRKQCDDFFTADFAMVLNDYHALDLALDPVRRGVVLMMLFNLGLTRLKGFLLFLKHARAGEYDRAGCEMLKSKWRKQIKNRAHRMAAAFITGEWV